MKAAPVYSTSEARANFAEALLSAQIDGEVIGFDRYGRTIAALVPVEAIYMLAGQAARIDPVVRARLESRARAFVAKVPNRIGKRLKSPKDARPRRAPKKKTAAGAKPKRR